MKLRTYLKQVVGLTGLESKIRELDTTILSKNREISILKRKIKKLDSKYKKDTETNKKKVGTLESEISYWKDETNKAKGEHIVYKTLTAHKRNDVIDMFKKHLVGHLLPIYVGYYMEVKVIDKKTYIKKLEIVFDDKRTAMEEREKQIKEALPPEHYDKYI